MATLPRFAPKIVGPAPPSGRINKLVCDAVLNPNPRERPFALGGNTIFYRKETSTSTCCWRCGCGLDQQLFLFEFLADRRALDLDFLAIVLRQSGAGRNEPANDDVFLESNQPINLAVDRRFGQHPRGLLERGRRD